MSSNRPAPRDPGLAAVLSFVIPGLGQLYAGRFFWALFWIVFTSAIWFTTTCFGVIGHLLAAAQAYRMVQDRRGH